jgi:hypothetical protein
MRSGWTGHLRGRWASWRGLLAESVAILIATCEPSEDFSGLQELVVERLRNNDARELLDSGIDSVEQPTATAQRQ